MNEECSEVNDITSITKTDLQHFLAQDDVVFYCKIIGVIKKVYYTSQTIKNLIDFNNNYGDGTNGSEKLQDVANDFVVYIFEKNNKDPEFMEKIDEGDLTPLIRKMLHDFLINEMVTDKGSKYPYLWRNFQHAIDNAKNLEKISINGKTFYCHNRGTFKECGSLNKIIDRVLLDLTDVQNSKEYTYNIEKLLEELKCCLKKSDIVKYLVRTRSYNNEETGEEDEVGYNSIEDDVEFKIKLGDFLQSLSPLERAIFDDENDCATICKKFGISKSKCYRVKDEVKEKYNNYFK